ncbi:prepilin-type N-terminal cleavage/methylation domain-containing protein [Stieleria sp. TO1_6]|uniref:prepilin-type N-terminal cleavage/methylation domain-containing protein n=1 Tax=Stieleria tagensis TaxID=2956795 RepID=UPI00209AC1B4|nr:prepilin-type N-terminal cleavage/methylation domain-containing protein [Stieleria tagensis]MCO8121765.1 prepilin-type N-terminal cleavage/methylation domain-containing protein [Stieleria tagensis]
MNQRPGLTLLEVVVALVLMGSILVASLLAFSKHRHQLSLAEKRIQATRVADDLVHQLSQHSDGIPIGARGLVAGKPGWIWQTSLVGMASLATVPLQVVRVELIHVDRETQPLVWVDLVKPIATP